MTSCSELQEPRPIALVALWLAPLAPPSQDRESVERWLARRWGAVGQIGMDVADGGLPPDPVAVDVEGQHWLSFLAGRRDASGRSSARYFQAHDLVGVIIRIAADEGRDPGAQLAAVLADEEPTPRSVLGQTQLFVCSAHHPSDLHIETALRACGLHLLTGRRLGAVTESGVLVAEVDGPTPRSLAVVIPEDQPHLIGEMTWIVEGPEFGGLLRYAIHAAKLRYEFGVFLAVRPELRRRQKRLDAILEELFHLHASLEGENRRLERSLVDARSRLGRAQGESAGVAVMASRLKELARSSRTALHNLRVHAPAGVRGLGPETTTSFDRDEALARWLAEQVEQELGYLASVRERVAQAERLTTVRLEHAKEEQARLANWLSVLQTSVLGAVLGCLGVIEALNPPFKASPDLIWAVLVTVAVLSLLLPALTLRWVVGLGPVDCVAGGVCGATVAWTLAAAASADIGVVGAAISAGAVLGGAVLYERQRHHRSPSPPDPSETTDGHGRDDSGHVEQPADSTPQAVLGALGGSHGNPGPREQRAPLRTPPTAALGSRRQELD